jgi:Domain of unknown function (DUF2760)
MRISLAFRAFFSALFNRTAASKIEAALKQPDAKQQEKIADTAKSESKTQPPAKAVAGRSEALTLLSALQREARFLDLVNESLDQFTDAQIGAAARDVIRDSRKVLKRMFDIHPLLSEGEGHQVSMPENASAIRWSVVGSQAKPGESVTVVHAGWQAKQVQLPQWTGSKDDQLVLAPAEVELSSR